MRTLSFMSSLVLLLLPVWDIGAAEPKRPTPATARTQAPPTIFDFGREGAQSPATNQALLPIPPLDAQAQAEQAVRKRHGPEFQAADPAKRVALAKRLMEESREPGASWAERFVVLREAADLAAAAGDAGLVERGAAELASRFRVDSYQARYDALARPLEPGGAPPWRAALTDAERTRTADALADLADDAALHERFELAGRANERVTRLAREMKLDQLVERSRAQAGEITILRRHADDARLGVQRLGTNPNDAAANLAVGTFACFVRGDWNGGLRCLAKGSDALLAELAKDEICGEAKNAESKVELADGWWNVAEKLGEGGGSTTMRARIMVHAALLYRAAVPDPSAPNWKRVEERLAVVAALPAPLRPADMGPAAAGKLVAGALELVADDFVVDIYLNGKLVAIEDRKLKGDVYGAEMERAEIAVHEGDWLVFHVANNQLRWGGACYFACAGVKDDANGTIAFVSETQSGRWLACDDLTELPRFIAERDYLSDRKAQRPTKEWDGGDVRMRQRVPGWNGEAVWGTSRSTWIKYVVTAAATAAPAPASTK